MMTRKKRRTRRSCIICVGEVNVIITYIIPQAFAITKYASVILTSNLWNFTTDFQTVWS